MTGETFTSIEIDTTIITHGTFYARANDILPATFFEHMEINLLKREGGVITAGTFKNTARNLDRCALGQYVTAVECHPSNPGYP